MDEESEGVDDQQKSDSDSSDSDDDDANQDELLLLVKETRERVRGACLSRLILCKPVPIVGVFQLRLRRPR